MESETDSARSMDEIYGNTNSPNYDNENSISSESVPGVSQPVFRRSKQLSRLHGDWWKNSSASNLFTTALSRNLFYQIFQSFFFLKAYKTSMLALNFDYYQCIISVHKQLSTSTTNVYKTVLW